MRVAGWVAIGVAVFIFLSVLSQWNDDAANRKGVSEAISASVNSNDPRVSEAELQTMQPWQAQLDADEKTESIEGVIGAAFLVAGIALASSRRRVLVAD